jgi:hypothetical protein
MAALAVTSVTLGVLTAVASLVGENYHAEPAFLDPFRAPTRDEAMIVYPAEYARNSTEYNDVIFLGDSTCRCSIDPAVFHRASGLSAYNLGSMGALGANGFQLILEIYLEHHPKPKAIVLAVSPDDLDLEASDEPGALSHHLRWSYGFGRGSSPRLPENLEAALFFARRGMQVARAYWKNFDRVRRFDPRTEYLVEGGRDTYLTLQQKVLQTRGYWSLSGKHFGGGTDGPNKPTVSVAKSWQSGSRKFSALAESQGIPFILRMVPVVDSLKTDYAGVRDFLSDFERASPEVTVPRPQILLYDVELCWDYQHLNAAGVRKFSETLAEDVTAVLSRNSRRPLDKGQADVTDRAPVP